MLLGSFAAPAVELADGKLNIHGFGEWGYGLANGANTYALAGPRGKWNDPSFALALRASLSDSVVVSAQLGMTSKDEIEIDWAFGEYKFSDLFRLRLGVVKHPFGLFAESHDVGTLRPFYLLPLSVYGQTNLAGESVEGASVSGFSSLGGQWSLTYDAYAGALDLNTNNPYSKLLDPGSLQRGGSLSSAYAETHYLVGARLALETPLSGLNLRVSGYSTVLSTPGQRGPRFVLGPSVQYDRGPFRLSAEYFFHHDYAVTRSQAAYVEASLFVTEQVQLGGRAELYRTTLIAYPAGSPLLEHNELAATLNYWFADGFVAKLSGHLIDGNRFAAPLLLDDALLDGTLHRKTAALMFGVQLSF